MRYVQFDRETGEQILSQRDVAKLLGVSVTTVQRLRKDAEDFPKRRQFSYNIKGWIRKEITEWVMSRPTC